MSRFSARQNPDILGWLDDKENWLMNLANLGDWCGLSSKKRKRKKATSSTDPESNGGLFHVCVAAIKEVHTVCYPVFSYLLGLLDVEFIYSKSLC